MFVFQKFVFFFKKKISKFFFQKFVFFQKFLKKIFFVVIVMILILFLSAEMVPQRSKMLNLMQADPTANRNNNPYNSHNHLFNLNRPNGPPSFPVRNSPQVSRPFILFVFSSIIDYKYIFLFSNIWLRSRYFPQGASLLG